MAKKKYFHNNYDAIAGSPSHWFDSIPFDDLMDWKIGGWEIPSSVSCMIRETNSETGKVKEYVYQKEGAARKKATEIMAKGNEFIVCTADAIQIMTPNLEEMYDDPLA